MRETVILSSVGLGTVAVIVVIALWIKARRGSPPRRRSSSTAARAPDPYRIVYKRATVTSRDWRRTASNFYDDGRKYQRLGNLYLARDYFERAAALGHRRAAIKVRGLGAATLVGPDNSATEFDRTHEAIRLQEVQAALRSVALNEDPRPAHHRPVDPDYLRVKDQFLRDWAAVEKLVPEEYQGDKLGWLSGKSGMGFRSIDLVRRIRNELAHESEQTVTIEDISRAREILDVLLMLRR